MRVLFLLVLMLWARSLDAETYYVATSGNDSTNPGTQSLPWRTIQKAANTVRPGDTVLIRGGTYGEKVDISRNGSAKEKIEFKAYPGEVPVVDGLNLTQSQLPDYDGLIRVTAQFVKVSGLEIKRSRWYDVVVRAPAHHVELHELSVRNAKEAGILVELGDSNLTPSFSSITNCVVKDNGRGGIVLWQAKGGYWRIEGNTATGNAGTSENYDGIQVGGGGKDDWSHHVVVRRNTASNNGADPGAAGMADNIDLGGHGPNHHYLVDSNGIVFPSGSLKVHSGGSKQSYHIVRRNRLTNAGFDNYGYPNPIAVYNNTFFGCKQCAHFYPGTNGMNSLGHSTGSDTGRMVWMNNVFFGGASPSDAGPYILFANDQSWGTIDRAYSAVKFVRNLYRPTADQRIGWGSAFGPPLDTTAFGAYKNSNSPNFPDGRSLLSGASATQLFVDPTSGDYRPAAGSPLIDTGFDLTTATNSGENSTTLTVDRASYFFDGYCLDGECLGTPDSIRISGGPPVAIAPGGIDDTTNTIKLASPATWPNRASVTLDHAGSHPNLGAYE